MKKVSCLFRLILCYFFLLLSGCGEKSIVDHTDIDNPDITPRQSVPGLFYSQAVQDTYNIYLDLPDSYYSPDSSRYPVLFILDADYYFNGSHWRLENGGVIGIIDRLPRGEGTEFILAGIGYPGTDHRERDLVYPADSSIPNSGGGNKFYKFLKNELIPYIDQNFRTTIQEDRTLIGHSLGGYFTLYTMFSSSLQSDHMFSNYLVISPTILLSDNYLFNLEADQNNNSNGIMDIKLYMSVGHLESTEDLHAFENLTNILNSHNYNDFSFKSLIYENLNHLTIIGPSINNGIRWLFNIESLEKIIVP
jgi:predicted alpha/beta superfamily hydrolase